MSIGTDMDLNCSAIESLFGLVQALMIEAATQATCCLFVSLALHLTNGQPPPDSEAVPI
jgi:hypothetical protein